MIILTVQCIQWYVWDMIRKECKKRNVMIGVRYVHETLKLDYVSKCYGYEKIDKNDMVTIDLWKNAIRLLVERDKIMINW